MENLRGGPQRFQEAKDHSWWSSAVVSSFCPLDQLEGNISRFELSKDNCVLVVVKLVRSIAP